MYEPNFGVFMGCDYREDLMKAFTSFVISRQFYTKGYEPTEMGGVKQVFLKCTALWDISVEFHFSVPFMALTQQQKVRQEALSSNPDQKLKGVFIVVRTERGQFIKPLSGITAGHLAEGVARGDVKTVEYAIRHIIADACHESVDVTLEGTI